MQQFALKKLNLFQSYGSQHRLPFLARIILASRYEEETLTYCNMMTRLPTPEIYSGVDTSEN
uniref:Uncharacterized protein n=1 Tax=Romanomermis culicivorax TaxID=13658 RepID=A0A915JTG8_ROMCU